MSHDPSQSTTGIRTLTKKISGTFARLTARGRIETQPAPAHPTGRMVWYVRRPGAGEVGPVSMGQIKRGIAAGRIPAECEVRGEGWPYWRPLWAIEEALRNRELRKRFAA